MPFGMEFALITFAEKSRLKCHVLMLMLNEYTTV